MSTGRAEPPGPRPPGAADRATQPGEREGTVVVEGTVRRITYEKDETSFRILRVETANGLETVVGTMPRMAPDVPVRVVGRRVDDARFGRQIQAESVTVMTPRAREGIERFLGSGIIRGIGPRLAKRIVDHFGDRTLAVLDAGGADLASVKGIGRGLALAAGTAWAEQQGASAAFLFLQGHGITRALATRIWKRYGTKTPAIVERSPYRLAMEIPGVGFLTADRIAQAVGIARDAPERMEAGVVHALNLLSDAGHTWSPREEVVRRAALELGAPAGPIDAAIDRAAASGHVILEATPGETRVSPRELFEAEASIADRIDTLLSGKTRALDGARDAITRFEATAKVTLAPAQRDAVEAAASSKVLVVTGGPGVGKTTIVRALLTLFERAKLTVRLAAPTGRAAKRMTESTGKPAQTIHRLLEVDPRSGRFLRDASNPIEADAFIVDEASMIDVALGRALFQAIPDEARVIVVGDVDQLPSVGPGALLRDLLSSPRVPSVRLSTIFRQSETSLIVEGAHRIREGLPPGSAKDDRGDFFVVARTDPKEARATVVELVTKRIPARFGLDPVRDIQVLTPMHKGDAGVEALNEELGRVLNPVHGASVGRGGRTLAVGDKVMQLKNDYDRDVYNGDVGIVASVEPEDRTVVVRIDDRLVEYDENALSALTPAYAVSIHKSQGSEYPAVVIPWLRQHYMMLTRNLLYTAVTRGKRLVVLVADPSAIRIALAAERKEERRTSLATRLSGD